MTYLRLLDADAEGADWREVARTVLNLDFQKDSDRTKQVWEGHTYAAIGEVFNCQKEFGFGSGSSRDSDPFSSSGGGRSNRDPFR